MNAIRIIIIHFGDNHGRESRDRTVLYLFSSVQIMIFFLCLIKASRLYTNFLSTHVRMKFEIFMTIKMQTVKMRQAADNVISSWLSFKNTNILQNYDQNKLRLV